MKTFKDYLIEVTIPEAEALFNLSGGYSHADVKKAYKKMSMIHHPDKGGDVEVMKKVNGAWKALKGATKSGTDDMSREERVARKEERVAKAKENAKDVAKDISSKFDVNAFTTYFEEHLGQEFTADITVLDGTDAWGSPSYAGITVRFESKDGKMAFDFDAHSNLNAPKRTTGLANSETISYTIEVTAFGYANRKKQKMSRRDWDQKNDHILLSDPSKTFPVSKMKKIASGSGNGKMKRADFKLGLVKEVKATEWNTDVYVVPVKDGAVRIRRGVIQREAFWTIVDMGTMISAYKFDQKYNLQYSLKESESTLETLISFKKMTMKQVNSWVKKSRA